MKKTVGMLGSHVTKRMFIVSSSLLGVVIGIIHGWILCQLVGLRLFGLESAETSALILGFLCLVVGWWQATFWLLMTVPDNLPYKHIRWRGLIRSLVPLIAGMGALGNAGRADTFAAICIGSVFISSIAASTLFRSEESN